MASPEAGESSSARQMEKCDECRKESVKQRCTPSFRSWPGQKCDRCRDRGLECGPNVRASGRKRLRGEDVPAPASNSIVLSTPPSATTSTQTNALLTPPSTSLKARDPNANRHGFDDSPSRHATGSALVKAGQPGPSSRAASNANSGIKLSRSRTGSWSERYTYLGYLRMLYETFSNGQRAVNPNGFMPPSAQKVSHCLETMAGNVVQAYKAELRHFVDNEDPDPHRLLEAHLAVNLLNAIAKRNICIELEASILQSLISLYRDEQNEPMVQHYLIALSELPRARHDSEMTGPCIANEIAKSMNRTSQELIKVTEEVSTDLASPLLQHEWLFPTSDPYPSLHGALYAGLDDVSKILAKDQSSRLACDFLKRKAIQVATVRGNTTFIQQNFQQTSYHGNDCDVLGRSAVFDAALHGHLETFRKLVAEDRDLIHVRDKDGTTLMDVLAAGNYIQFARCLLDMGFDMTRLSPGVTSPLHTAAERCFTEFCVLLLDSGVDATYCALDGTGDTAAKTAFRKSCQATNEVDRLRFRELALLIARAEKPPYNYSLAWIEDYDKGRGGRRPPDL